MQDVARLDDPFYIAAESERQPSATQVLKHGESFCVFDPLGDMIPSEGGEHGLYHEGTRFLSRFDVLLGRRRPLLLSSATSDDNAAFTASLTNPDVRQDGGLRIAHGDIHILRSRVVWDGRGVERIQVSNYALHTIEVPLVVHFEADFVDVFEVRGTRRPQRGDRLAPICGDECTLVYRGRDGVERRTRVRWKEPPSFLEPGVATFALFLAPLASRSIEISVSCEVGTESRDACFYEDALQAARKRLTARTAERCRVTSANATLNDWIRRSTADLEMMITDTSRGPYPYAGIPWFSTPFGRDGIITALELLWADPEIARGVLLFLADTQATEFSDAYDAQPGKILHEMRHGEMAALGEVPFGRYYGTVDATPLFVMLADAYFSRTADREILNRIWPNVLAALDWMNGPGDPDGDGFIEYTRYSESGLVQQGWKDSQDSVFHDDGKLADSPTALCEVQGYAYAAWLGAARLAEVRGDGASAGEWRARAERLRARFEEAFWCEDLGTYAIALDNRKRPCRVRSSNPGHCLFTGIVSPSRARRLATTLMDQPSFCGWGIRTIAAGQTRYNPMSYHNGSIWPHDNAIAAAGLARYGFTDAAAMILNAMFNLSQGVDLHRLPELICGFAGNGGDRPTLYPVACAPQAWAAGAVYLLLQACLGLRIEAAPARVVFSRAVLPEEIEAVRIDNLAVGGGSLDLRLERHTHEVGVRVLRRQGDVEIVAVK